MTVDIDEIVAVADGFRSDDEAREYIVDRLNVFKAMPAEKTLYRVVFLDHINQLNRVNLGHHWVDNVWVLDRDLVEYLKHECMGEELDGTPFVIKAVFDAADIDLETTLRQNVINPHEAEFFVRSCARPKLGIEYCACNEEMSNDLVFIALETEKKPQHDSDLVL